MTQREDITGKLAFVGFGEAARAFVSGWGGARPGDIKAYDIKTIQPQTRDAMQVACRDHGVTGCETPVTALEDAQVIFSLVTADQALVAAQIAAPHLAQGALWLDCNSCAPGTKQTAAKVIEQGGGRYVDVAVMAPVLPKKHHVPLLVSGPHMDAAMEILHALDMKPTGAGGAVGQASSIKMLRSVMIKGFEALTSECFLAARRAGVEDQVIASLVASDPGVDWRGRGAYNLERMMVHGARRAAEMREVVVMLDQLSLPSGMSAAAVDWQAMVAALNVPTGDDDLATRADALLARI